jgi:hypothetical protein
LVGANSESNGVYADSEHLSFPFYLRENSIDKGLSIKRSHVL